MDALLILAGMLLIAASVVWLISRAFEISLYWGFGSLLPPGSLLFTLRYWSRSRPCVLLSGIGFMVLVIGLSMLAQRAPQKLEQLLSLDWATATSSRDPALELSVAGEFNGQPFQPEVAELIDGVLTLRQGDDLSRRELRLHLGAQPEGPLQIDLLPHDQGKLPLVELIWVDAEQALPQARRITQGYTLHLDLAASRPNRMKGRIHLLVPGESGSSLSGQLETYTSRLRYLADQQVDPRFNSRETVKWLALDHLRKRAGTREVEILRMPPLDISRTRIELDMQVRVAGEIKPAELVMLHDDVSGWRVAEDRRPLKSVGHRSVVTAPPPEETQVLRLPERPPELDEPVRVDRRDGFNLQRLLTYPRRYSNLSMRIRTQRGAVAEGRFAGIGHDGRLQLRYAIGAGEASFSLRPSEIMRIELLEP